MVLDGDNEVRGPFTNKDQIIRELNSVVNFILFDTKREAKEYAEYEDDYY
jgi:hypothetical protein